MTINEALTAVEQIDYFSDPSEAKLNITGDPFAAAMATYRRWAFDNELRWQSLESVLVTDEDYQLAEEMKIYYRNKIAVAAIRGKKLSHFNVDLYELLSESTVLRNKHIGMLYRLPYMYYEDLARIDLWEELGNYSQPMYHVTGPVEQKLTPIKTILRSRRSHETMEYWYINEFEQPVLWSSRVGSLAHNLIDGISKWPHVTVLAELTVCEDRQHNRRYWTLVRPTLSNLHQAVSCYTS